MRGSYLVADGLFDILTAPTHLSLERRPSFEAKGYAVFQYRHRVGGHELAESGWRSLFHPPCAQPVMLRCRARHASQKAVPRHGMTRNGWMTQSRRRPSVNNTAAAAGAAGEGGQG